MKFLLIMKCIILFLFMIGINLAVGQDGNGDYSGCESFTLDRRRIGKGERLAVDCLNLYHDYIYGAYDSLTSYQCSIRNRTHDLLYQFNVTDLDIDVETDYFASPPFYYDTEFVLHMVLYFNDDTTMCLYANEEITITPSTNLTCNESLEQSYSTNDITDTSVVCGSEFVNVIAEVVYGVIDYNYTWYAGCNVIQQGHQENPTPRHVLYCANLKSEKSTTIYFITSYPLDSWSLDDACDYRPSSFGHIKREPELSNASIYTFMKSSNGYVSYQHYIICFKVQSNPRPVLVPNKETYYARLGSSISLHWSLNGGEGHSPDFLWRNINSGSTCSLNKVNIFSSEGNYQCMRENITSVQNDVNSCNNRSACDVPTKTTVLTLKVLEVKLEDLGRFDCLVSTTASSQSSSLTLLQEPDLQNSINLTVMLATIAGVLLLFLLTIFVTAKFFRIEFLLFWKKHFAPFEKTEREFDVFFSYSSNLKDTKDGKRFLSVLHDWFEVSNFNVFDQHRGHAGEFHYDLIQKFITKCHRMIILVTSDYLKSEIKLYDAHSGIHNYICGKTKIIFILLPKAQSYLEDKVKIRDSICLPLIMAMKERRNAVILWNKETSNKRLLQQVNIAMPKLRPRSLVIQNLQTEHTKKKISNTESIFDIMSKNEIEKKIKL